MKRKKTIYFIEGLPGTGKTTISRWLQEEKGAECISESDSDYPNDLCDVAGIPREVYGEILREFPCMVEFVGNEGEYIYINIQEVRNSYKENGKLLSILEKWDIGDEFNPHMNLSHYIPCSLELLVNRIKKSAEKYDRVIFDSVWLQNPINELLSRNADGETIIKYCAEAAEKLKIFNLSLIHLKRDTVDESVKFACYAKGKEWENRVTELFCSTPYGTTHNLGGVEGLMRFFSERAKVEEKIISEKIIRCLQYTLEDNDWDKVKNSIWEDVENN